MVLRFRMVDSMSGFQSESASRVSLGRLINYTALHPVDHPFAVRRCKTPPFDRPHFELVAQESHYLHRILVLEFTGRSVAAEDYIFIGDIQLRQYLREWVALCCDQICRNAAKLPFSRQGENS